MLAKFLDPRLIDSENPTCMEELVTQAVALGIEIIHFTSFN